MFHLSVYESVIDELKPLGYNGIFVVYDEFGKFLEGSVNKSSAMDIKLIQDFAEKCNRSGLKQLHIMLPVPERLHSLISRSQNEKDRIWTGDGKFANYVEIETLLPVSYLQSTTGYESNNICGTDYFKAKDDNKKSLWKDLILQDKEIFADFIPLFQAIHSLFGLSEF